MLLTQNYNHWNENCYYLALDKFYGLAVGTMTVIKKSIESGKLIYDNRGNFTAAPYTTTPNEIVATDHCCANGA